MKAIVTGDIRLANGEPGCIEFNAFRRRIFYTCPCGCGFIASFPMGDCFWTRYPTTIGEAARDPVNQQIIDGGPMLIGILEGDKIHWEGTLRDGEWKTKEGPKHDGDKRVFIKEEVTTENERTETSAIRNTEESL